MIAVAAGGATETVRDGETGILVPPDDADAIARAMRSDALDSFEPAAAVANAQRFSVAAFQDGIREQIAVAEAKRR